MDNVEISKAYERWLMERVLIDCWTVAKCAKEIDCDVTIVQADFDKFIRKGEVS